jgi:hypothetical protein
MVLASLGKQGIGCAETAVRIICAARKQGIPIGGDPANGICQAGGFVQLTQINRAATSSVIAYRWLGRIGARLGPASGPVAPRSEEQLTEIAARHDLQLLGPEPPGPEKSALVLLPAILRRKSTHRILCLAVR